MRYAFILLIINIFFCNTLFSQSSKEKCCRINERTLKSLKYNPHTKKSESFKMTCRTILNKNVFMKSVEEGDLIDVLSSTQFLKIVQYNLRARWKFKNLNHIYVGTNTFTVSGSVKNLFYMGFKKNF